MAQRASFLLDPFMVAHRSQLLAPKRLCGIFIRNVVGYGHYPLGRGDDVINPRFHRLD
jgi:hypothetical protein